MLFPAIWLRRIWRNAYRKYLEKNHPKQLAAFLYNFHFGRHMSYDNPQDLSEKINWMKFYSDTSMWTELADKYLVRNYVEQKGLAHLLVTLYGAWSNPDDIDFNLLPQSFVLKTNNSCGTVMLVKNKEELNITEVKKKLKDWLSVKTGIETAEPHYLDIIPMVIAEEYLAPGETLIDYKLFVVHGETELVMVCSDRKIGIGSNITLYDKEWNYRPDLIGECHAHDKVEPIEKPEQFEEMKDYAQTLCQDFPFVRMDFYIVNNKVYFGEMTFTPKGGYNTTLTWEENLRIGKLITLPEQTKYI